MGTRKGNGKEMGSEREWLELEKEHIEQERHRLALEVAEGLREDRQRLATFREILTRGLEEVGQGLEGLKALEETLETTARMVEKWHEPSEGTGDVGEDA